MTTGQHKLDVFSNVIVVCNNALELSFWLFAVSTLSETWHLFIPDEKKLIYIQLDLTQLLPWQPFVNLNNIFAQMQTQPSLDLAKQLGISELLNTC